MSTFKKINNIKVHPVVTPIENDASNVKGYKMIPQPIYTLFICSKKKSGKSSLINLIANKCTDKRTIFWIFCSTYRIDSTWKAIIKMLKDRGNQVNLFDSIMDGKTDNLLEIVDSLAEEGSDEEEPDEVKKYKFKIFENAEKKKKEYKPKKKAPENMFIFDDISNELRGKSVCKLLKEHRHSNSSVIVSSQYLTDLQPSCISQIDFFICFRSFPFEKLEVIHKLLDLSIPLDLFWDVYKQCTEKLYNFMYLNVRNEDIRQNFNTEVDYTKDLDI